MDTRYLVSNDKNARFAVNSLLIERCNIFKELTAVEGTIGDIPCSAINGLHLEYAVQILIMDKLPDDKNTNVILNGIEDVKEFQEFACATRFLQSDLLDHAIAANLIDRVKNGQNAEKLLGTVNDYSEDEKRAIKNDRILYYGSEIRKNRDETFK